MTHDYDDRRSSISGRQERRRRQQQIDRKARRLYARAPRTPQLGEDLGAFQERIRSWMDQTEARLLREEPDDTSAILERIAELNVESAVNMLRAQNETNEGQTDEVRMEDRPVVATPAASTVLGRADVKAMLRRYEEMCRQSGQTVRGRSRVGNARVCVFRHPDNIHVNMWLWDEDPDDGQGTHFRTDEMN